MSEHVVMLNKQETLCGKNCEHWQHGQQDIDQLLSKSSATHHPVCILCLYILEGYVKWERIKKEDPRYKEKFHD